jgi:hypothetical protein
MKDAIWVRTAQGRDFSTGNTTFRNAFEHLFTPLVLEADMRLWASVKVSAAAMRFVRFGLL